ncbi:MAG: hypothetical protein SXQ77_13070 [Halobacteria archaeon]|nr:hypothetical protein [Halobacteria archaeon]
MEYAKDDRAVSVIIGAVLLLGILVTLLALLQVNAVPIWNKEVEIDHNQRVQDDMKELRGDILQTASGGSSNSVTVQLGRGYPNRFILRNPPPFTGTLSTFSKANLTIPNANITLDNVNVEGETGDYWNGAPRNFSTRSLYYEPDYNYHHRAGITVYENTLVYNRGENPANVTLTDQSLIDGRRISIVTLNGSLSTSQGGSVNVETVPVSAPSNSITVKNGSNPITIDIPTTLPNSTWSDVLSDEYVSNGGHIAEQDYTTTGTRTDYNILHLRMETGVTYNLGMARVGVGNEIDGTSAHYITDVSGNQTNIPTGSSQKLVAEVRDRYNNPVSGVEVNANVVSGGGTLDRNERTTDVAGRVGFEYNAPSSSTSAEIEMNISGSPVAREKVTFVVSVFSSGTGGGGGGGGGGTIFADDFEDGSLSPNWTRKGGPGNAGVNRMTSSSGSYSAYTCCGSVRIESDKIDLSGQSIVAVEYWVRRGGGFSEDPDAGEDLLVQYRNKNNQWITIDEFSGGGTDGQIYVRSMLLPSDASHSNFQLRFRQTRGSSFGNFDYWHIDDVKLRSP